MDIGWIGLLVMLVEEFLAVTAVIPYNRLVNRTSIDDYLDICLDGRYHKKKPGPEGDLFAQCTPWKKRSCCTSDVSKQLHTEKKWYNFDWNHCYKPLSPPCRSHFIQDLCFYECSPNVGPWLVQVRMKIRNEKFVDIPLCKSECELWWNDCQEDYTCTKNWARGFNWTTGTNTCLEGKECRKFKDYYTGAEEFCTKLWDYSWKVVPDSQPCMKLWFDKDGINPNDIIARRKAFEMMGVNVASVVDLPLILLSALSFLVMIL